jgi:type VI secretion system secreted protein VgrG
VVKLPNISNYEIYDYPGEYEDRGTGDGETKIRMEEEEVPHDVVNGSSTCRTFTAGGKFKLSKHGCKAEEAKTYVITSIHHSATDPTYSTGGRGETQYNNTFTCIPDSVVFRPARTTPKPLVSGLQTAVVVGPKGEEIYCDEYGRVKVQFHWDREGKKDENSSIWMRCMQSSAGKQWGTVFIPRIGQEVVIDFLEGDPDQPLVTGLVYNAEQMPHYSLPAEKTKSYFKTNSSPGGDGFNELRFEDKNDQEQIFIHAQRNMDQRVLNDSVERVINNRHLIVGSEEDGKKKGDQNEMVYQNKNLNVMQNQAEHIEGNMQLMIGNGEADDGGKLDVVVEKKMTELIGEDGYDFHLKGNRRELIDKSASLAVGGDQMHSVGGNKHLQVKGSHNQKVDGSNSLDVGMSHEQKVGIKHAVDAGQEIHLKAGMKVIIEAGMQISLVGPGGFVDIGPAGVTIQGIMVKINSGGAAGSGSGASPEAPKDPAKPEDAAEAAPTQPNEADDSKTGQKSAPD